jgi:hypothetical protein
MDVREGKADMHITNYKVVPKELLVKRFDSEISDLRWIETKDYTAGGGQASGTMIMSDGKEFIITYNWKGVSQPENFRAHKTYTILVKGEGIEEYMKKYIKQIIADEGKPETGIVFDFAKEIEPWRCLEHPFRTFWRGIRNDFNTLIWGYSYRFKHYWRGTLPNESYVRSLGMKTYSFVIARMKRKQSAKEGELS